MRALILALPLAIVAACGKGPGPAGPPVPKVPVVTVASSAELQASSTLQQRYAALVQLYKALGGGWEEAQ